MGCQACASTLMYTDQDDAPHCLTCGRSFPTTKPPRPAVERQRLRPGRPSVDPYHGPTRTVTMLVAEIAGQLVEESGPLSWRQLFNRVRCRGGDERGNFDEAIDQLKRQGRVRPVLVDGKEKLEEVDDLVDHGTSPRRSA